MKVKVKVIIACLLTILATSFAYAKDIHVPDDYPTIQEAIDAATSGDRVIVAAGTYEEKITLKSNVDILGAGAGVTTIVAPEDATYVVYARTVTNMEFDGFTIDGVFKSAVGIYCENSSSFTISNNIITQCSNDGIDCIGTSNPTISSNIITQSWRMGIYVHASHPTISDNTITQNGMNGIWCFLSSYPTITNNKITYNGDNGIQCSAFSEPKIFWNEITNNNNGVYVYEDANPYLGTEKNPGMNSIYDNTWYEVRNDTENTIMAEMNWWGQTPPISGQFYGDVDYDPWLSKPPFTGSITIISPDDGDEFPVDAVVDIVAEVRDQFEQLVAGVEVTFEATGGTVDPTVVVTDENGQAITLLTVAEGENTVTAIVTDCPDMFDTVTVIGTVPTTGSINGTVTDIAGKPLRAFVIAINAETKEKTVAVTKVDGYYEIPNLEPGIYLVLCIKKGYEFGIRKVEVVAGEEITVDFKLSPKLE